jgi:putative transposase
VDVPQHVIERGHNRQPVFFHQDDYSLYLQYLHDAAAAYHSIIHAYVLMTNHVHVLMTPHQTGSLAKVMQSLGRRYVQYINTTYHRTGTLWEGRYRASLVEEEGYLLACYRYIELNPVRAGMVPEPAAYPWSSYRWHALGHPDPVVTDQALYLALGNTPQERQQAYQVLFQGHISADLLQEIRATLQQGRVLGTERFHEELKDTVALLINTLAEEMRINTRSFGSATFRRADLQRGFEPDGCFYVQSATSIQGRTKAGSGG